MNALHNYMIDGHLWIEELTSGYPVVVISNEHATAKIALHGAHLIEYTPTDQPPVIFTSAQAEYRQGKAIRGGIPICWPWFSAHPNDPTQPAHGIARNNFWNIAATESTQTVTRIVFTFITETLSAELTFSIGKELNLSLKTTNLSTETQTVGGALHSYFALSDISHITLSGLENTKFFDSLTGQTSEEHSPIKINEEIDRVYLNTSQPVTLHDPHWQRDIIVEKTGSLSTVIWNPWIDKSKTMSDLANDEYLHFACIETANALEDVYPLTPGASHTLQTTIRTKIH